MHPFLLHEMEFLAEDLSIYFPRVPQEAEQGHFSSLYFSPFGQLPYHLNSPSNPTSLQQHTFAGVSHYGAEPSQVLLKCSADVEGLSCPNILQAPL